jgi:hypothetical protein
VPAALTGPSSTPPADQRPKTEPTVVPETTKVGVSHKISRADVASFLLQAATDGLYSRRAVIITG